MRILVFGDSHSNYFKITSDVLAFEHKTRGFQVDTCILPGSSIKGFGSRKSTLMSNDVLYSKILTGTYDKILIALGQVDIELGFYYRNVIKDEGVDIFTYSNTLINTFESTLVTLMKDLNVKRNDIIIKDINPPVLIGDVSKSLAYTRRIITENITSQCEIDEYNNKLKLCFPSAHERNRNHRYFNSQIKLMTESLGVNYLEISDCFLNSNGFVDERYIPAKGDHHLIDSLYVRLCHINRLVNISLNGV